MGLTLTALISAISLRVLFSFGHNQEQPSCGQGIFQTFLLYLNVWGTYLGKAPPTARAGNASFKRLDFHVRLMTFVVSFWGVVVWCVYRAALTSELTVQVSRLPFDSLESLLESDYQ